ncbi:ATP-binding protein [Calditerrivibrio nitroreducens]|nr:transporter substrate-binding domain-containing protein [Calditerrivibrio nitroreducens]
MRKIIILIGVSLLILFSCYIVFDDSSLTREEKEYLKHKKEIVFVSQINYPPFEFLSDRLESSGMMVELARLMSTEFGFESRFINTTFARAQQMILNGEADVLTSFFFSEERNKKFNFTKVVFEIPASIFVKQDNDDIKKLSDLHGKRVAIQKGDYAIDFIKSKGIRIDLIETDDFIMATNKLIKGEVEAVIGDDQIIFYYLSRNNLVSELKVVGEPLYIGENCMATRKSEKILVSILNKGINLAKKKGYLDSINRKWIGERVTFAKYMKKFFGLMLIPLSILLLIVFVFWIWNLNLRKRVEERTKQLSEKNKELALNNSKLNAILSASPDGIGVMNMNMELVFISDKLAKMYKIEPEKKFEYLNKNITDFVDESYRDKMMKNISDIFEGKKYWNLSEYLVRDAYGEQFWVEVSSSLLYDDAQKPYGILFVERDCTERKRIEQQLLDYNEKLKENNRALNELKTKEEEANIAKSNFLAIISHELRTPLNGVLGLLELIHKDPERFNEFFPVILSSGEQLRVLINDISDLTKVEQGKLELVEKRFSISNFINEIVSYAKIKIQDSNLELVVDIEQFEGYLEGDAVRLRQVVYNLINNAIKYTDNGFVKVVIRKLFENDKIMRIYFEVTDTGIGISPNDIDNIFKPFKRLDGSYTKKRYGSGIGLYISKAILNMMNSNINVESEVGKGSKFYFKLDLKRSIPDSEIKEEISDEIFNLKALVVDDNKINLFVAENMLAKLGVAVDFAENGMVAIEKVSNNHYDFIMMDLQMPEMDGLEATRRILDMGKDVKIFAMTANVYKDDIQKALNAGMVDFCPKPFTLSFLKSLLSRHFK